MMELEEIGMTEWRSISGLLKNRPELPVPALAVCLMGHIFRAAGLGDTVRDESDAGLLLIISICFWYFLI
jgi:hypothetical protein